jgi:hypothetical protein
MYKYYKSIFYPPLKLSDFTEVKKVSDDTFNKIKDGDIMLKYYIKNKIDEDSLVGYIKYRTTGQVGLFFITNKEYQNRGLGKQILTKVINELVINQCKEVWAVTIDDHPFWSNVYNKQFIPRHPAHPSVGGSRYYINLKKFKNN